MKMVILINWEPSFLVSGLGNKIKNFPIFAAAKSKQMDKRIHTLIFLYVIYFLIAINMLFFKPVQQFMTGFLFGATGILIFLMFFSLWLLQRKD